MSAYVLNAHPELAGATVKDVSTQVVAGINYIITYDSDISTYNVVVWHKAWQNFIKITKFTKTPKP